MIFTVAIKSEISVNAYFNELRVIKIKHDVPIRFMTVEMSNAS